MTERIPLDIIWDCKRSINRGMESITNWGAQRFVFLYMVLLWWLGHERLGGVMCSLYGETNTLLTTNFLW